MNSKGRGRWHKDYDLFVMDGKGTVYAGSSDKVDHHTDFLAGGPVAAAGLIKIESGRLTRVIDESGHYRPTQEHTQQFLQEMQNRGIDLAQVQTSYEGKKKAELADGGWVQERVYPEGVRTKPY